ncbi:helix-turn-helix domain-containing protein [Tabrizicola sp.]|uniref:helix-turn-helix domain-containing protein n=1 Tax=Tabrizicola sp. TaxID=2005166 RepID=UPI003F3F1955
MAFASKKNTKLPGPRFPGDGPRLVTPTRNAALSVTRFAPSNVEDGLIAGMPADDAHVILFQLRAHPAHDFWVDGKYTPAESAPRATLSIFDLGEEPHGRLTHAVDTLMFHIPKLALDEIAEDAGARPISTLTAPDGWRTHDPIVSRLQDYILDALAAPGQSARLLQDHVMLGLAAHFAQAYGGMAKSVLRQGGLAPWQESRAKEFIAANLSKSISLQDIADKCGLSLAHFSRAFKTSVGTTPHNWLQIRRIALAKDLLLASQRDLAAIALDCGFADQSHFTRTFSRSNGEGPGAWRRARQS